MHCVVNKFVPQVKTVASSLMPKLINLPFLLFNFFYSPFSSSKPICWGLLAKFFNKMSRSPSYPFWKFQGLDAI